MRVGGATPWDKYEYLGQLSTDWGIDGSVIQFANWGEYFIWSCLLQPGEPQTTTNHQAICIAPLLTPSTLGPRRVISSPTFAWETFGAPVNEGPHALYHGNKTYITFSASLCSTAHYSLGLLTWLGDDPSEKTSWIKNPHPVLKSANGNIGTGHNG